MSYGKTVRDELRVPTRELRHAIPQVYAGYKELHDAALGAGVLDAKTKELIALAIAVSKECDGCIAAHAHAAVQHGASPAGSGRGDRRHLPDERRPRHRLRGAGVRGLPGVLQRAGQRAQRSIGQPLNR